MSKLTWWQKVFQFFGLLKEPQKPTKKRILLGSNKDYPRVHRNQCKHKQTSHGFTTRFPTDFAYDLGMTKNDGKDTVCLVGPVHEEMIDGRMTKFIYVDECRQLDFYKLDHEMYEGVYEDNPSYRNTSIKMSDNAPGDVDLVTTKATLKAQGDSTALGWFKATNAAMFWEGYWQ